MQLIFTEFALRGAPKADEAKKVKAMILCGKECQASYGRLFAIK